MNIYAGNLPYGITESDLQEIFEAYGEVTSVKIIVDKFSGRSKGVGFVEMKNDDEAKEAIDKLNNSEFNGRNIKINQAREKNDNPRRNFRQSY